MQWCQFTPLFGNSSRRLKRGQLNAQKHGIFSCIPKLNISRNAEVDVEVGWERDVISTFKLQR